MDLVQEAKSVFCDALCPKHFTNYRHCCECAEHNETLLAHTPETIGIEELGNPGWDPLCFATDEAFEYYFPAMVRMALEGTGERYYVDQFLFHLIGDGLRNRRWKAFSPEKRAFVLRVLEELLAHKSEEIERNLNSDDLINAIEIWSDSGAETMGT